MEKYKIIATKEQLKSIGLNDDEFEREAEFVKSYDDGWVCLKVDYGKDNYDRVRELDFPLELVQLITTSLQNNN